MLPPPEDHLRAALSALPLRTLNPWLVQFNLRLGGETADIVNRLVAYFLAHPADVPTELGLALKAGPVSPRPHDNALPPVKAASHNNAAQGVALDQIANLLAPLAPSPRELQDRLSPETSVPRDVLCLNPEVRKARVQTQYADLHSVLRPWFVFCQLRDLANPGSLITLVNHATHLLLLAYQWRDCFSAILDYHLEVAIKRVKMGEAFPRMGWFDMDPTAAATIPLSVRHSPPRLLPSGPRPGNGASTNKRTRKHCDDGHGCHKRPSGYRNACGICGQDGHPQARCPSLPQDP